MPPHFTDDKAPICIPFILKLLKAHQDASSSAEEDGAKRSRRPFIIGLNGLQGVGKTTLVAPLAEALQREGIPTLVCSIDDFYLTHEDQVALARSNPDNALWQCRGEPGTHDIPLTTAIFNDLISLSPTSIPKYDKSAFSGQGDRLPPSQWDPVNHPGQLPLQVILFEGWCVGFRPISKSLLAEKHSAPSRTLHQHKLEHLSAVNEKLKEYDSITNLFDAFIHIDSENTEYVYDWRQEQEEHLREAKGDPSAGMTRMQVIKFVDAYYPAYELYSDDLRKGVVRQRPGSQLRMIVGRDRKVKEVVEI